MKKMIPLLLALLVLSGCGGERAPAETEVLPENLSVLSETTSLPGTNVVEPISAPAMVTEGRFVEADDDLLDYLLSVHSAAGDQDDGRPGLKAELPEAGAAFYAVPGPASGGDCVLLRWGESFAEFDWAFGTPCRILPWMECRDIDGDKADELIVDCYWGSGTGVSVEALHIVEKSPDGTLTAYTFPESLWQEQFPALFGAARIDGRTFAVLGRELVEFSGPENLDLETASAGSIAGFDTEGWSGLTFRGAFCLNVAGGAVPCYVAETSAVVVYQDGVFTLQNFHLYSFEQ